LKSLDVNVNVNYSVVMKSRVQPILEQSQWGIREFAKLFDVTPRTIRFYEDKGLISPSRDSGARIFTQAEYLRVERIMRGKRLGFTLDDIKEVFEVIDGSITDRVELLRRKSNFQHVILSLKRRREDIADLAQDMSDICEVIDTQIKNTPDGEGVFDLAQAYEAKFSQTPFIEETVDQFQSQKRVQ